MLICLLCVSCFVQDNKTSKLQQKGKNVKSLSGMPLLCDSTIWGSYLMEIVDDYPLYKVDEDGVNITYDDECWLGMLSYVTQRYIYLLPDPFRKKDFISNKDYKGYPAGFSDIIYVFDWDGNFIDTYTLDTPVCTFVVDARDSCIYALSSDIENGEEYYVRKYIIGLNK